MNQVYQKDIYKVYHADDGYIVHNVAMDGFAHSHVKNYKACIWLINLSLRKSVPNHIPTYLLGSLIRINNDIDYLRKLNELMDSKKNRHKDNYYNANKGVRKK